VACRADRGSFWQQIERTGPAFGEIEPLEIELLDIPLDF